MSAVFAPPAAARAEERARVGGSAHRGCLLWHHPGQTGPEEPAGGGRLQRGSWPGPQRAPKHNQHAAGVVGITSMCLCTHFGFKSQLSVSLQSAFDLLQRFLFTLRCTGCEAVLCGIEEQVSRANQYRESQLKVKVQVETEVSPSSLLPTVLSTLFPLKIHSVKLVYCLLLCFELLVVF